MASTKEFDTIRLVWTDLNGVARGISLPTATELTTLRSRLPQTVGSRGMRSSHLLADKDATPGELRVRCAGVAAAPREFEFINDPGAMDVAVTDTWTTRYQRVTEYNRTWTGSGDNPYFGATTEHCLRLDSAVQLCESWADSYHQGLVDVPLSMFEIVRHEAFSSSVGATGRRWTDCEDTG